VTPPPVVVVTRPEPDDGPLSAALRAVGFTVVHAAAFSVVTSPDAPTADDVEHHDWAVWTSVAAVDAVAPQPGAPQPGATRHAAVGTATAAALRGRGIVPEVTGTGGGASLADALVHLLGAPTEATVLYPRSERSDGVLATRLRAAGVTVDDPVAYRIGPGDPPAVVAALRAGPAVVTFASPSAVSGVHDAVADDAVARDALARTVSVSIGPTTSDALVRAGRAPDAEATEPTFTALARAAADAVGLRAHHPPLPD
jgi:uroporphyrinogen-III synthase